MEKQAIKQKEERSNAFGEKEVFDEIVEIAFQSRKAYCTDTFPNAILLRIGKIVYIGHIIGN